MKNLLILLLFVILTGCSSTTDGLQDYINDTESLRETETISVSKSVVSASLCSDCSSAALQESYTAQWESLTALVIVSGYNHDNNIVYLSESTQYTYNDVNKSWDAKAIEDDYLAIYNQVLFISQHLVNPNDSELPISESQATAFGVPKIINERDTSIYIKQGDNTYALAEYEDDIAISTEGQRLFIKISNKTSTSTITTNYIVESASPRQIPQEVLIQL